MCQTRETRGEPDTQRARLPPPPAPRSRREPGGQTNATKQVHKRGRGRAEGQTQRCSTSGQEGVRGQVRKSLPEQLTAEWKRVTERASRGGGGGQVRVSALQVSSLRRPDSAFAGRHRPSEYPEQKAQAAGHLVSPALRQGTGWLSGLSNVIPEGRTWIGELRGQEGRFLPMSGLKGPAMKWPARAVVSPPSMTVCKGRPND